VCGGEAPKSSIIFKKVAPFQNLKAAQDYARITYIKQQLT
jgi:hypothetical protein